MGIGFEPSQFDMRSPLYFRMYLMMNTHSLNLKRRHDLIWQQVVAQLRKIGAEIENPTGGQEI